MKNAKELLELLTLEKIGERRFRGNNYMTPWGIIFGGQVLGQALHAAYQTVPKDRFAHSMHGYFILPGNTRKPVEYEVDTIRNGGSFTTRRVVAFQDDKAIFNMSASFQVKQEGIDHQVSIPNVLPPEVLLPDYEQIESLKETDPDLHFRLTITHPNAIEFRPVENLYTEGLKACTARRHVWFKSREEIKVDLPMQHQLLAYASDYNLLTTSLLPHINEIDRKRLFLASLDHAIWFHRDLQIDDWLLYATDSPSAGNSRALCRGDIFNRNGELVASVAQEGLVREIRSS